MSDLYERPEVESWLREDGAALASLFLLSYVST